MFGADTRGQAIQIGAVVLFSFVVLTFSLYQATVVPDNNAEVEFNHNDEAQQDLAQLRAAVLTAATTRDGYPVPVDLGPRYPPRVVAVNPGPPSGTLTTVSYGTGQLTVANVRATDAEVRDYWSGSVSYETNGVEFRPNYNVYAEAPTTVYENSVLYNVFDSPAAGGPATVDGETVRLSSDQTLVDWKRVDLVALVGERQDSTTETVSVDPTATTVPSRTVTVQGDGGPITVSLPTNLDVDAWRALLEDEYVSNGGYVEAGTVSVSSGVVSFDLRETEGGTPVSYQLRVPAVGVGGSLPSGVAPAPAYATTESPTTVTAAPGETVRLTAGVYNQYNGPEGDVPVSGPDGSGGTTTVSSAADGTAGFDYAAPSSPGSYTVTVETDFDGDGTFGEDSTETVTFTVDVVAAAGGGGGGADYELSWTNPDTAPGAAVESCSAVPCGSLSLEVQADDPSGPTVDGAPVSFGSSDSGVATFGPSSDGTIRSGTATADLDRGSQGRTTLQAYSGGNRATLGLVVHLTDGFEDGSLGPEWTNIDGNDASVLSSGGSSVNRGSNAAVIADVGSAGQGDPSPGGGFQLNGGIDSSAGELVVVEFWARENGPERPSGNDNGEDESLYVEYLDSSGNWVTAANLGVDGTPTNYPRRLRISDSAAFHPDFAVRFRQRESTGSDDWYVDDVAISVFGPAGSTESDLGGNTIGSGPVTGGGGGAGDSDPPSVTSITVEDAPIDYADAANQETVIVEFDEPMDTSVEPTVRLSGVTASDASGDTWLDDTTFRETVDIAQNSEDVTATVAVSDARDASGNTMSPNPETATFVVDTERPGDVQAIDTPIVVDGNNAGSLRVEVTNPGTVYGDEQIELTFEGPDGGVVTATEPLAGGAGDTTNFDIDVSALADGTSGFSVSAVAVDDVGNTGATKTVTSVTKDTVAPSVETFDVTRTGADEFTVTVEATDATTGVDDLTLSTDGPGTATRINENSNANEDTYTYERTYEVDRSGEYTVTLDSIVDGVGNDGASGTTRRVTVSDSAPPTTSNVRLVTTESSPTASDPADGRPFDTVVSFDADGRLSSFTVDLAGPDGQSATFDESDFTESGSGPYTYTLRTGDRSQSRPYQATADGTYTATVSDATDVGGNTESDGASGSASFDYYGVVAEFYQDGSDYNSLSDVRWGSPTRTDTQARPFDPDSDDGSDFAYRFTAHVYVPQSGDVRFRTTSDDGSRLYIDGTEVVDNGGLHASESEDGTVSLLQGWHDLTVTYFESSGQDELDVSWDATGGGLSPIETEYLVPRPAAGDEPPQGNSGSQNGIRYDGGLTTTSSNSAVQFDIENVGSSFARIESVRVDSQISVAEEIWAGSGPGSFGREVEISGGDSTGYKDVKGNPGNALVADGSSIDLDSNAVLSTSGSGATATVSIGDLGDANTGGGKPSWNEYDLSGLTRVSQSDPWDIRVVLELQSGGEVMFYFEES